MSSPLDDTGDRSTFLPGNGGIPSAMIFDGKVEYFLIWTMMFISWLKTMNLFTVLEQKRGELAGKALLIYEKKSIQAYSFIMQAIPMALRQLTQHIKPGAAFELWESITSHFTRNTKTSKYLMYAKLSGFTLAAGESISSYVARIQSYAASLEVMGSKADDGMILFFLLKGLPDSYTAFTMGVGGGEGLIVRSALG